MPCPLCLDGDVFLFVLCMFVGTRRAVSLRGADGCLLLIVMVRQMIDDCICPIKLLNEQQTYHLMRKGHL